MAKSDAVWGIDIGQCSLKAIRCHAGETPDKVVVDAFDYIAYPKILSQPGADPVELVQEALKQFLSRNSVKGDRCRGLRTGTKWSRAFHQASASRGEEDPRHCQI